VAGGVAWFLTWFLAMAARQWCFRSKNVITNRSPTQILMDECLSKEAWDVQAAKKYQVAKLTNNLCVPRQGGPTSGTRIVMVGV
jgi:hypothetical protein